MDTQHSMAEYSRYIFEYEHDAHTPSPPPCYASDFALWLSQPDSGWIDSSLHLGNERFLITFSDVYPPFLDFLEWAIGLSEGREMPPVEVDDEHSRHFFKAMPTPNPTLLSFEYLRYEGMGQGMHYKALVSRRRLIAEIYKCLGFLMSLELEEPGESGSPLWFSFQASSSELVHFDLRPLEIWLEKQTST